MSAPSAPAFFAPWAWLRVELGTGVGWAPTGDTWGTALWGTATWGSGFEPEWHDVTAATLSFDTDTGRSGIFDPGDVAQASLVLFDPEGSFGIAGTRVATGSLLRAFAQAGADERPLFLGRVTAAKATGDLVTPTVSVSAIDSLGTALGLDLPIPLPAQTVTERLHYLLDRVSWPERFRDIEDDATALLEVEDAKNLLDSARLAAESAGGTLWATGAGVITYRDRNFGVVSPDVEMEIGTQGGDVAAPTQCELDEDMSRLANIVNLETAADDPAKLHASIADPRSIARFGPVTLSKSDLVTAVQADLNAIAARLLAAGVDPIERVDPLALEVHDELTARAVLLGIGSLVHVTYTGADPWERYLMLGGIDHKVSPDGWSVGLRCYDALSIGAGSSKWGLGWWGVSVWAESASKSRELVKGAHHA
jgi:hypothetical protein